jgi:hypothetical protein
LMPIFLHLLFKIFECLKAPLYIHGLKQMRLNAQDFGQGLRFTGRDPTLADGCQDALEVGCEILPVLRRREFEFNRSLSTDRDHAFQAQPQSVDIPLFRQADALSGQLLGFALKQLLGHQRGPVSAAAGAAGRVATGPFFPASVLGANAGGVSFDLI